MKRGGVFVNYAQLAEQIIAHVGGRENVNEVTHCMTRLRFNLRDDQLAETELLREKQEVLSIVTTGAQYQIVIGQNVGDVYQAIIEYLYDTHEKKQRKKPEKVLNRGIDFITSIMTPLIGILVTAAILKGSLSFVEGMGWIDQTTGMYAVWHTMGNAIFYYLPIFLAITTSKKLNISPFIGVAIAAILLYPTVAGSEFIQIEPIYTLFSGTVFESPVYFTFFGIPVILMDYSGTIFPIVIGCYLASRIEKVLSKYLFGMIKKLIGPLIILLIIIPITLLFIGPVTTILSLLFVIIVAILVQYTPILAGLFIGGIWQLLIALGLHWAIAPLFLLNMTIHGYDNLFVLTTATVFSQSGAVLGVLLKTNDAEVRQLAIPSLISGIFGITEPAIYGITLPRVKPFVISCIAGAIGGAIIALIGVKKYALYGFGVLTFTSLIDPQTGSDWKIVAVILTCIAMFLLSAVLTYFTYKEKEKETKKIKKYSTEILKSPLQGDVQELAQIHDPIFASGAMGKGIAILPDDTEVKAPVSGMITSIFPNNHAFGILSEAGAEILIHFSVEFEEEQCFERLFEQGEYVVEGQMLMTIRRDLLDKKQSEIMCVMVVLNSDCYLSIDIISSRKVIHRQAIMQLNNE